MDKTQNTQLKEKKSFITSEKLENFDDVLKVLDELLKTLKFWYYLSQKKLENILKDLWQIFEGFWMNPKIKN